MTPRPYLFATLAVVIAACNGLTGIDKYDLFDCDGGSCSDGGEITDGTSGGDADGGSSDGGTDSPSVDTGVDVAPTCNPTTQGLVTLSVACKSGTNPSVTSDQPDARLSVACGLQGSSCFPIGQVRLRGDKQAHGSWSGACNQSDTDTCEFTLTTAGAFVSVTNLQPN